MIQQDAPIARIFLILVAQPLLSLFFFIISYKVLSRKRNRFTLSLSAYYILMGNGFIFNVLYLIFSTMYVGYILYLLYFITIYLIILAQLFILIFVINIFKINPNFTLKKNFLLIFSYSITSFLLLLFPEGITINENTNWVPIYSWSLLVLAYIFLICWIFIPTLVYSIKLYYQFEDKYLKRKFMYFIIGAIEMFLGIYGTILYNAWHDPLFRAIWGFLVVIIMVSSGSLIYYGIVQNL